MTRNLPTIQRSCGPCSACCTILGVAELEKREGERCSHLSAGRCGIYAERPESCRAFQCFWLMGLAPVHLRPDKCDAMITTNKSGKIVVVHETKRGASKRPALFEFLARTVAKGITVYIIHPGADRTVWNGAGRQFVPGVPRATSEVTS